MKWKGKSVTGILIALFMVSSTFVMATTDQKQPMSSDLPGEVDFSKTVWNEEDCMWTDILYADIGNTYQFNITLTYHGVSVLHHIQIIDLLPEGNIQWEFNPDSVQFINAPEIPTDIADHMLYWNFSKYDPVLEDNDTISILFNLTLTSGDLGEYNNCATFFASECLLYDHSDESCVLVILREHIDVDKRVWDGENWVDAIEGAHKNDIISFQITVTYHGPYSVKCMILHDILPETCMDLAEGYDIIVTTTGIADYPQIETGENGFTLKWTTNENLFLQDKESVTITFFTVITCHSEATLINEACACAWGCYTCGHLHECDTAQVTCEPLTPSFEKSIRDGDTWVNHKDVIVGETVRFQLKLTYRGNYAFSNIRMTDLLPCVLTYIGNANYEPFNISENKKIIQWDLNDLQLNDSEYVVIEFDALVTGVTGCGAEGINIGQATATEIEPTFEFEDNATITATENYPPSRPILEGQTSGKRNQELTFHVLADNYQEPEIWYYIDWGDDSNSGWIGPYPQGEQITITNSWDTKGNYQVKAKSKDIHGAESDWSNILTVTIKRGLAISTQQIQPNIVTRNTQL
jgi:uncharacterized repeat protein (TIGR01451 family)